MTDAEAYISMASGAVMVVAALLRWDKSSLPLAAVGAVLLRRGAARSCPLYKATGMDDSKRHSGPDASSSVTINRSAEDLYSYWRDVSNAPSFMAFVDEVEPISETRSRWKGRTPLGYEYEYVAEIVEDSPNEGIRWRTVEGSPVVMRGAVRFKAAAWDRGTTVIASMVYGSPSGGSITGRWAKPFATHTISGDLKRFKQLMETGVIATTEGQPVGPKRPTVQPTGGDHRAESHDDRRWAGRRAESAPAPEP